MTLMLEDKFPRGGVGHDGELNAIYQEEGAGRGAAPTNARSKGSKTMLNEPARDCTEQYAA